MTHAEMASSLESEASYLAKWLNDNKDADVDTIPIEYAVQTMYEIAHNLKHTAALRAQAAMALLGDELGD